jgi:hypothetical protein
LQARAPLIDFGDSFEPLLDDFLVAHASHQFTPRSLGVSFRLNSAVQAQAIVSQLFDRSLKVCEIPRLLAAGTDDVPAPVHPIAECPEIELPRVDLLCESIEV